MVRASSILSSLALAFVVAAEKLPHDEVEAFGEDAPDLVLKYKPFLKVSSGCIPYPAVNAEGDYSGGLDSAGLPTDKCGDSDGQVYSRHKDYDGKHAILYTWYMPKDHVLAGGTGGHRHDWESIVVWLSSDSDDAEYLGIAWSAHGEFSTSKAGDSPDNVFEGSRPLVEYYASTGTHSVRLTDEKGGEQDVIDWDAMPEAAHDALGTDWGNAVCPLIDGNLSDHLEKALL